MLDTEKKVDEFLVILKAEIMAAKMEEGVCGPFITAEGNQVAGFDNNGTKPLFYFNPTIHRKIIVNIFHAPAPYYTFTPEQGEHSKK